MGRNFKIWHPDAQPTKLKFGKSEFKIHLKTFMMRKRIKLNVHTDLYQQVVQLIINEGYVIPIVYLYRWVT